MSDRLAELIGRHFSITEKLVYFLLASAGTSIGFAITLKTSLRVAWPDILVIFAVFFWAGSFYSGIRVIYNLRELTLRNANLLRLSPNFQPHERNALENIAADKTFLPIMNKIDRWRTFQLALLVIGALALFSWRIASAYPNIYP